MLDSWEEDNASREQIKNNDSAMWMTAICKSNAAPPELRRPPALDLRSAGIICLTIAGSPFPRRGPPVCRKKLRSAG
jgi:hypothetical protein